MGSTLGVYSGSLESGDLESGGLESVDVYSGVYSGGLESGGRMELMTFVPIESGSAFHKSRCLGSFCRQGVI